MRFHRFFSPEPLEDTLKKAGDTVSLTQHTDQLRKVFRLKTGDSLFLFDGSGFDFLCMINDFQGEATIFSLISREKNKNNLAAKNITLVAALVKKDTFEWIVEKATELGVSKIVPVVAERSEKKNINVERLQKIITEAAEQSGRATIPELSETIDLATAISTFPAQASLVWDTQAPVFDRVKDIPGKTFLYIGPEGGWSIDEIDSFKEKGITLCSMGPQTLRAETAVVAALSIILF
jgi:16S rRNA (uracil1498-N3)-methyltransferase